MCINVPVTTILAANYRKKKAIHESSKNVHVLLLVYEKQMEGGGKSKIIL